MRTRFVVMLLLLWAVSFTGSAQNNVTSSGGTPNAIPLFTGSLTLSDSAVTQLNGNIGIGTSNPTQKLEVNGIAQFDGAVYGTFPQQDQIGSTDNANLAEFPYLEQGDSLRWRTPVLIEKNTSGSWTTYSNPPDFGYATDGSSSTSADIPSTINQFRLTYNNYPGCLDAMPRISQSWPPTTFNVLVEASGNGGSSWTTLGSATGLNGYQNVLNINGDGCAGWLRFTFTITNYNGNPNFRLNGLEMVNTRPGDQGQLLESLLPFNWDYHRNIGVVGNLTVNGAGSSSFAGNVGIGTTSPGATLEVNGNVKLTGGSNGSITFPDGSSLASAKGLSAVAGDNLLSPTAGNITLSHPTAGGASSIVFPSASNTGSDYGFITYYDQNSTYAFWGTSSENSALVIGAQNDGMNQDSDVVALLGAAGDVLGTSSHPTTLLVNDAGNVGIGTTNPQATLEVNGNVKLTSGSGASITFPDGTVQTTAYAGTSCPVADLVMPDKTIVAQGGDYAESVDVNGDRASYEPGDVMVIGAEGESDVNKSSEPYSTLVAGIYSTKPGYVGRRQHSDPKLAKAEIPMAMIGIVPTKVTAENGPIHRGDLLVSSSKPGYAMKGTDRTKMTGAVLGKAMGNLNSDTGVIEVLVTLQ